jgi:hypothetical protein
MIKEKSLEARLRRAAERQGLMLEKSRRRDPRAIDYGMYRILDPRRNVIVFGAHPHDYSLTLGEVEDWLNRERG